MVGDSGSGKTRFLNTDFNLGRFVVGSRKGIKGGWKVKFEQEGIVYFYEVEVYSEEEDTQVVNREYLMKESGSDVVPIIERNADSFKFCGDKVPKLKKSSSGIELLENEDEIKPLVKGFGNILLRNFSSAELNIATRYDMIPRTLLDEKTDMEKIFHMNISLNLKLYYLMKKQKNLFESICDRYMSIFPFIKRCELRKLSDYNPNVPSGGLFPVFSIKEKYVDNWIPIDQISSGMQKVLLIITDGHIFPDGSICLIDEYENSLGINAINFFPEFLDELDKDVQFIVTSHHPYIINKISAENWYVFHRKGHEVTIKYGEENIKRYGKSKQQRFVQLINDPFFLEGVE